MNDSGEKDWIICCDSNKMQLSSYSGLLRDRYNILACLTGKEAIDAFVTNISRIRAVLLEVNLPDMSGLGVYAEIKRMNIDVPVFLATNNRSESDELNIYRKYRPHGYFLKSSPSMTTQLKAALNEAVDSYNQRLLFEKMREAQIVDDVTKKLQKQFEKQLRDLRKELE